MILPSPVEKKDTVAKLDQGKSPSSVRTTALLDWLHAPLPITQVDAHTATPSRAAVIDMVQPSATVPAIDQGEPRKCTVSYIVYEHRPFSVLTTANPRRSAVTFSGGSPVTPASKLFAGAALPDMASMAESQGNAKLQEFVDKIGELFDLCACVAG